MTLTVFDNNPKIQKNHGRFVNEKNDNLSMCLVFSISRIVKKWTKPTSKFVIQYYTKESNRD